MKSSDDKIKEKSVKLGTKTLINMRDTQKQHDHSHGQYSKLPFFFDTLHLRLSDQSSWLSSQNDYTQHFFSIQEKQNVINLTSPW